MKKTIFYFALASLLLNVYYHAAWIYYYNNASNHAEAVLRFNDFIPSFLSTTLLLALTFVCVLCLAFNLSSVKARNSYIFYIACIIIQASFMLFYTWQLL